MLYHTIVSSLVFTTLLMSLSGCSLSFPRNIPEAIPAATSGAVISCACPSKRNNLPVTKTRPTPKARLISTKVQAIHTVRAASKPFQVRLSQPSSTAKNYIAHYTKQQRDIFGPPLSYAVSINNLVLINQLLDNGENIEATDRMGLNPLGLAITEKSPQTVDLLLRRGANISADVPPYGQPLVAAIEVDSPEVVKVLLRHNVNKDSTRFHWRRPLDIAREKGNSTIIALLEKANASSANDDFERESAEMKMYDRMGHYGHP